MCVLTYHITSATNYYTQYIILLVGKWCDSEVGFIAIVWTS